MRKTFLILVLFSFAFLVSPQVNNSYATNITIGESGLIEMESSDIDKNEELNNILEKYKYFVMSVGAFAAVTMVMLFIIGLVKLGALGGSPQGRATAISGLLTISMATAGLGIATLLIGIAFAVFIG